MHQYENLSFEQRERLYQLEQHQQQQAQRTRFWAEFDRISAAAQQAEDDQQILEALESDNHPRVQQLLSMRQELLEVGLNAYQAEMNDQPEPDTSDRGWGVADHVRRVKQLNKGKSQPIDVDYRQIWEEGGCISAIACYN